VRWQIRFLGLASFFLATGASGPALAQNKGPAAATCGEYGTSIHFEKTPKDAARRALKEEKLVMVLHVSGLFEESEFT
jgi:hypothetical protein